MPAAASSVDVQRRARRAGSGATATRGAASAARSPSRTARCSATRSSSSCSRRRCCRGCWRGGARLSVWSAGLLGRRRAALARAPARPHGRARPRAPARQRPAGGEPRAGAGGRLPGRRCARGCAGRSATCPRTARRQGPGGSCCAATSRSTSSPRRARRLYETLVASLSARGVLLLGRSERLIDPRRLRAAPGRAPRLRAGRMRRRLTTAHGRRVGADRGRRGGRAGGAGDRDRPSARRRRARPPLAGRDRRREPHPAAAAGRPDRRSAAS